MFSLHQACYELRICDCPPRKAMRQAATLAETLQALPQPELRRVALRYLEVVATTLRASTVALRADSLIVLGEYLAAAHPDVRRLDQLERHHLGGFLAWNHRRPWRGRVAREQPVSASVSKRAVVDLRGFFDLAVWGWADRPSGRVRFSVLRWRVGGEWCAGKPGRRKVIHASDSPAPGRVQCLSFGCTAPGSQWVPLRPTVAMRAAACLSVGGLREARSPPPFEETVMTQTPELDELFLTGHGRVLVETRIRELGDEIRTLRRFLDVRQDPYDEASLRYQRASVERSILNAALEDARPIDDLPEDSGSVILGDTVTVRFDDGTVETFVVAQALEAVLDDMRISDRSPLGRAVLGRKVGEDVEVGAPGGAYRCTILRAVRERSVEGDAVRERSVEGDAGAGLGTIQSATQKPPEGRRRRDGHPRSVTP